jgi:Mrp family chromosome partitioning ATPase
LKYSDYHYVLLDAPPLLGIADSQLLARHADAALVVCRVADLTPDDLDELRTVLDQLPVESLGLVVIGGGRPSAYYARVTR